MRRIHINGVCYLCNVGYRDNIEYWTCANAKLVSSFLKENGHKVISITTGSLPEKIEVDRSEFFFCNEKYVLNQCNDNILEWFASSKKGEFTYYHEHIVFNTISGGFYSIDSAIDYACENNDFTKDDLTEE